MSLNDFVLGKQLGKGSFGSVWIVTRKKDNINYAMKRVNLSRSPKTEIEAALNEIRLLASLIHPNIIGYKETFYDAPSGTLNIVMELADAGDLSKRIEFNKKNNLVFQEDLIWEWIIQILNGVLYLHDHQIIHRDLKCANIFLMKNGVLKIGDLNVSKLSKNDYARTKTGTPYYLAPEVWADRPYDYKCDIWSIGCIIYELCCLVPPFRGTNFKELHNNIKNGIYNPIPHYYSQDLKTIISKMLVTSPSKRLSARELFNCNIIQNRMKSNSRKDIIEKISKSNQKYNLIGTIKMPRNIKDINRILPHENYQMEGNDPFETMKKTIKLMGNAQNNNNNNVNIQPLNNYNRELANQKKQNHFNNNNLIDNQNKNINNNNNNMFLNPNNIKPIIISNEQNSNNNNRREYNIFNNNNNSNNPNNNLLNYNNKQNNDMIPVKEIKTNSKNSIKQSTNTRKKMEKEKFDKIKNEFKVNKQVNRSNKNQKPVKQNDIKQRRPPSGDPRKMNYNNNNPQINKNNNYKNYNNQNNINYINNNNMHNNNNNKYNNNKNPQRRPLSHHNNRIDYNNPYNNNYQVRNNNYIKNNNIQNNNYPMKNNNMYNNNNRPVRKYEIKNHNINYNGQNFDMKPYKKQNKANYDKLDVKKYKDDNKKKFNNYLYKGGRSNNNNNKQINPNRQRVNPAVKHNNIHRYGKY